MLLDQALLDKVSAEAKESPRLRMNFNLHESLDSKVQRLFNAMEPGTVVPIQRHQNTAETMLLVRGKMNVYFHNQVGDITETFVLSPKDGVYGVHIPKGQWHSVEVLESGTVMFEVKEGPYAPLSNEDIINIERK